MKKITIKFWDKINGAYFYDHELVVNGEGDIMFVDTMTGDFYGYSGYYDDKDLEPHYFKGEERIA